MALKNRQNTVAPFYVLSRISQEPARLCLFLLPTAFASTKRGKLIGENFLILPSLSIKFNKTIFMKLIKIYKFHIWFFKFRYSSLAINLGKFAIQEMNNRLIEANISHLCIQIEFKEVKQFLLNLKNSSKKWIY